MIPEALEKRIRMACGAKDYRAFRIENCDVNTFNATEVISI